MRLPTWLARTAVVAAGIFLHSVAWWLREGQGGQIADLPNLYWQHAVGVSIGIIVMAVVGPLFVKGPAFVVSLILGHRVTMIDVSGLLFKAVIFIGIFAVWIPWEFWFR